MINVLHIMGSLDTGGQGMVILNYYKNMNKNNIQFDIAITNDEIGKIGKELQNMGAHIYSGIPLKSEDLKGFKKHIRKILTNKTYNVIHVHQNQTSFVALSVAKEMGVNIRIAHSHTIPPTLRIKSKIKRLLGIVLNNYFATHLIGCGQEAAQAVFGKSSLVKKKLTILPNAIEVDEFRYNISIREEYRKKMNLENKFIIGTVGRLAQEKNQEFLLRIQSNLVEICPNSLLVIVGDGPLKNDLRDMIVQKNLEKKVLMLGNRQDISSLLQMFDVFLLPSYYEGFPVTVVEAATAGLPIILSEHISHDVSISKDIKFVSLDEDEWVDNILYFKKDKNRRERFKQFNQKQVDVQETVSILEGIYGLISE